MKWSKPPFMMDATSISSVDRRRGTGAEAASEAAAEVVELREARSPPLVRPRERAPLFSVLPLPLSAPSPAL